MCNVPVVGQSLGCSAKSHAERCVSRPQRGEWGVWEAVEDSGGQSLWALVHRAEGDNDIKQGCREGPCFRINPLMSHPMAWGSETFYKWPDSNYQL